MKKLLFCAGVLALAVSCTEELDTLSVQQEQAKGISFVATDGNDAATKGHFEEEDGNYLPFWWAEQDRIAIFSTNTKGVTGGNGTGSNTTDAWAIGTASTYDVTPAMYKATQSQRYGWFTGVDDNNTLDFNDATKTSQFLAIYPYTSGNTKVASQTAGTFEISGLPVLTAQTQKDVNGNGIYENMVKWSYSTAKKENSYDAVGEKVNLNFQRVLSGMVFKTANASEYTVAPSTTEPSIFGNLKTIKATLVGVEDATAGYKTNDKTPALTYNQGEAKLTLTMPAKATGNAEDVEDVLDPGTVTSGSPAAVQATYQTITLTMDGGGLEWDDNARAYMVTLPLKLKGVEGQYLKVEWNFANIDFERYIPLTAKDWNAGTFYTADELDINDYAYLLTNESSTGSKNRTLIVNKGAFADVFLANGNINWPVGTTTGVEKEEVKTIIVKEGVTVTKEDVAALNEFENLANVTMPGVTEIPEGAFDNLSAKLETINMPDVTTIDEAFVDANLTVLENLNLHSYAFENETVNDWFFTSTTSTLVTLDMSGVDSMTPKFGVERTLSFQGFTALKEVTVQDGVRLCANAFSGCINLATVNGVVDMQNGSSAFKNDEKLEEININSTEIPASAFDGCDKLTKVLYNGAQVAPTKVGAYAFKDVASEAKDAQSNPVPFYMDLSNAETIGVRAFEGSALTSGKAGSQILSVGVETVEARIFSDTKVCMVQFLNATKVQNGVFATASTNNTLRQVKFLKPFTYEATDETAHPNKSAIFGGNNYTAQNVILFVSSDQEDVDGASWSDTSLTFAKTTSPATAENTYTFKSITVEDFPYAEE